MHKSGIVSDQCFPYVGEAAKCDQSKCNDPKKAKVANTFSTVNEIK